LIQKSVHSANFPTQKKTEKRSSLQKRGEKKNSLPYMTHLMEGNDKKDQVSFSAAISPHA
jgi:hypothetical protein